MIFTIHGNTLTFRSISDKTGPGQPRAGFYCQIISPCVSTALSG